MTVFRVLFAIYVPVSIATKGARSFGLTSHTNHTIHACTAAAMRAATVAMRKYARTRATNHGLLANTALNPPVAVVTMFPSNDNYP